MRLAILSNENPDHDSDKICQLPSYFRRKLENSFYLHPLSIFADLLYDNSMEWNLTHQEAIHV